VRGQGLGFGYSHVEDGLFVFFLKMDYLLLALSAGFNLVGV